MNDVSPADAATSPALPPRIAPRSADREVAALEYELATTRRDLALALHDLRVLRGEAEGHVAGLTPRQREVMVWVLAGHPSKNIAADLGISCRTVENHRASIMRRTGARSLPGLTKLALAAGTLA